MIELESEATMRGRGHQRYQIWDPVDGLLEEGSVAVRDMVTSQPWLDESFDFPWRRGRRRRRGGLVPSATGSPASRRVA